MRRLAEEAKHFHTTVSSTAGSVGSESSEPAWQSYPGAETSVFGDFPSLRRERVKQFLEINSVGTPGPGITRPASVEHPLHVLPTYVPHSRPLSTVDKARDEINGSLKSHSSNQPDDEDVELQKTFVDGLRELATASINERKHSDAIVYLQEALSQNAPGEETREMQMQLALCYLVEGKCRSAEPLIKGLAGPKVEDNLFVCNLLHALALAYLSQNFLDDAMTTCKQALQGKMRLLKSSAADSKEYWITLGLFARIFRITGDTLRAEVFRRKLPSNFVYYHPENEVEFVHTHMIMNQTEIESAIPEHLFDVSPSTSPNDADDEVSPSSATQSPLRRQFSRFFGPRRHHGDSSEETLVPSNGETLSPSPKSATTTFPLKIRWLRGKKAIRPKPKAEIRSREDRDVGSTSPSTGGMQSKAITELPKKCPILSHVRQAHENASPQDRPQDGGEIPKGSNMHRRFSWTNGRYTYYDRTRERFETKDDGAPDHKPLDAEGSCSSTRFAASHMGPVPELSVSGALSELADTGKAAELPDTSLARSQIITRHLRCDASGGAVSTVKGIPDTSNSYKVQKHDLSRETKTLSPAIRRTPFKARSTAAPDTLPPSSAAHGLHLATPRRDALVDMSSTLKPKLNKHRSKWKGRPKIHTSLRRKDLSCEKTLTSMAIPADLSRLLSSLTAIMAPLAYIKDLDDLRTKKAALETLLPDLRAMSNDKLIVSDAERVVRDLGQLTRESLEYLEDSGYESMAKSKDEFYRGQGTSGTRPLLRVTIPARPAVGHGSCKVRDLDAASDKESAQECFWRDKKSDLVAQSSPHKRDRGENDTCADYRTADDIT